MPDRRPAENEFFAYFSRYVDRVPGDDVRGFLAAQERDLGLLFDSISEERSTHRYAPGKWSIKGVLGHVNDCERVFSYRALWFARGLGGELPSFEESVAAPLAASDSRSWPSHVAEFRALRAATRILFEHLPDEAWGRSGIASGKPVTVRALAYVVAGHAEHHAAILRERYGVG
jgi:hypothetical protein